MYSHRNARANLDLLGQPNTLLAQVAELAEAADEELHALGLKRVEIKRLRKALPPGAS